MGSEFSSTSEFYRDAQGFGRLDAGSCAGFTSVFQFALFLYNVWP